MVASDLRILELILSKRLEILPFVYSNVQPSSIDLTLDNILKVPKAGTRVILGQAIPEEQYDSFFIDKDVCELSSGMFALAQVKEKIKIPKNYCCSVENRSGIARLGLDVAAAGYINPGYEGQLPIMIRNHGTLSIKLVPGVRICQIVLHEAAPTPLRDYSQRKDVKYMGESNSLISKLHLDEELRACVAKIGGKEPATSDMAKELSSFWDAQAVRDYDDFIAQLDDDAKKELGIL
ncbi:hypothetical protein AGMMS50276_28410 [Synergistales bacterium]|nr:hypothetical protein AGMMS50276_28410 [Synergistales bacterium]